MSEKASIVAIYICKNAGDPMNEIQTVAAIQSGGLHEDRNASGNGSWNKGKRGQRQVTLIAAESFEGTGFEFSHSRRNIVTRGVETNRLIGVEFVIGSAHFLGIKYCYPCDRPSELSGIPGFRQKFFERGGIIAEIVEGGMIAKGDEIRILP